MLCNVQTYKKNDGPRPCEPISLIGPRLNRPQPHTDRPRLLPTASASPKMLPNMYRTSASKIGSCYKSGEPILAWPPSATYLTSTSIADSTTNARRLVLYASNTPHKRAFAHSLNARVRAVEYDVETATKESMIAAVEDAVSQNGGVFASIGLACHGSHSGTTHPTSGVFHWIISEALVVTEAFVGDDVTAVMQTLGRATTPGGRVDLFACDLLKTETGRAVFQSIQAKTDAHFAASDDRTGCKRSKSHGEGQDWVMESDGVNIKPFYFKDSVKATWSAVDDNFGDGMVFICRDPLSRAGRHGDWKADMRG